MAAFPALGLVYQCSETDNPLVTVFGDCSFAPTGKASHEGHAAYIGSNLIGWRSKRQRLTTMSSCEGELFAASHSLVMGRVLRLLVAEFVGRDEVSVIVNIDNQPAIQQILQGECAPWRTRHISIRGNCYLPCLKVRGYQSGILRYCLYVGRWLDQGINSKDPSMGEGLVAFLEAV